MDFTAVDEFAKAVEQSRKEIVHEVRPGEKIKLGLDLGTCFTVLAALDEEGQPLACEMERSNALKDGVVVDYHAACEMVKRISFPHSLSIRMLAVSQLWILLARIIAACTRAGRTISLKLHPAKNS